ncbi:MAG: protein translocase subunit SecD [Burkholderiaceae bacterium]|nr:protein translocase subunit SecD [Burkholderiaceae bacterium]
MNRYPLWKYILVAFVVALGLLYTVPNFFGDQAAIQIGSNKATVKVDPGMVERVQTALETAKINYENVTFDLSPVPTVRVRFRSNDEQAQAQKILEGAINPDRTDPNYIVSLTLLPASPAWMTRLHALPMNLGLDLRGGVHLLLQVDMKGAVDKRVKSTSGEVRAAMRKENLRGSVTVVGENIEVRVQDDAARAKALNLLKDQFTDMQFVQLNASDGSKLVGTLTPAAIKQIQDNAISQNILTLNRRVNELGVAEPIIQQQGADRIVVQLAGVSNQAEVEKIIGRTATLEVRMVDESVIRGTELSGTVPFGSELFKQGKGVPVVLRKDVIVTGDSITNAQATFDENQQPAVSIDLTSGGGNVMRQSTRDRVGKLMAIVLFEKNRGEVLSVATIQEELGSRFRITNMGSTEASNELALLLRAGSLAAPMEIIETRTVGPSLGAENIKKGFNSTLYGFAAIAIFMMAYYLLIGAFSVIALGINVILLIALLSLLQATLTLPGIAAIALTLGMAIDANVLINERIREELRNGAKPADALNTGFEKAWATILDSNITTLIAGIALFAFGSGPVRGFAVVHCLGILTSMFSAVVVARAMVNLYYGGRKKLHSISIGQVWKPANTVNTEIKA